MQGSAWSHSLNIPEKANAVYKNNLDDTKHVTQILLPYNLTVFYKQINN